jgi:uncharacterized membrane protein YgaE (UPF0421/DUF939 family)
MATEQKIQVRWPSSTWDFFYALDMALACLLSYSVATSVLSPFVAEPDTLLGGMWATVATVFVFRETRARSLVAVVGRLIATGVSFALCFAYLLVLPFHPAGMAVLLGIGTLILMALGRRDDIITTGITTTVLMLGAALSPHDGWRQPLLRLGDTVLGVGVGMACKWIASFLYDRCTGKPTS